VLNTTGISGVYPPGIAVGTVRGLAEAEAGWMKSYFVEPAAFPARTGVALIWDRPPVELLMPLAADSLTRPAPDPPASASGDSTAAPAGT
jgi:cell shape-determining protein MreC